MSVGYEELFKQRKEILDEVEKSGARISSSEK
jgi:hypothetical protein